MTLVALVGMLGLVPTAAATAGTTADGEFRITGMLQGRWGPYQGSVRAYPSGGYLNPYVMTEDGTFELTSSDPAEASGPVELWVEGSDEYRGGWYAGPGVPLSAAEGDAVELAGAIDLGAIELEPTPWIDGTVTSDDGPVSEARVVVTDTTPGAWPRDWSTATDAEGRFRVSGIAEGVSHLVEVRLEDDRYVGGYSTGSGGTASQLEADAVRVMPSTTVDVRLQRAVSITGTVTAVRPPYPRPPQVNAYEIVDGTVVGRSWAMAEADGSYELRGLRPGVGVLVCFGWFLSGEVCHAQGDAGLVERSAATPVTAPYEGLQSTYLEPALTINPPRVDGAPRVGVRITATNEICQLYGCSFAWLRDGTAITGASSASYVPVAADYARSLAVQVTVAPPGHRPTQATGIAGKVALGAAPRAASLPRITGTPRVGGTLKATSPSWSPSGVTTTYQWWRGTTRIVGATKAAYAVRAIDAGKRLKVVVSAKKAGYATGTSAQTIDIAKVRPTLGATLPRTRVHRSARAAVEVTVAAQGLTPTGTVVVSYEVGKTSVRMAASARGKVTVRLPRLRPGSYGLIVRFKPDATSAPSMTGATRSDRTLTVT
jgi:hypothetical protein